MLGQYAVAHLPIVGAATGLPSSEAAHPAPLSRSMRKLALQVVDRDAGQAGRGGETRAAWKVLLPHGLRPPRGKPRGEFWDDERKDSDVRSPVRSRVWAGSADGRGGCQAAFDGRPRQLW